MISKVILILTTYALFAGGAYQSEPTPLQAGLKYALTQSPVVEEYSVDARSPDKDCSYLVILSSAGLEKETTAYMNASNRCVLVMAQEEFFFEGIDTYFKLESFTDDENEYKLSLKVSSPDRPKDEQPIFVLRYKVINGIIDVISFEKT